MNETYDVSAFRAVFERSFTWISGFLRNVRRFGEKTAVIDPASRADVDVCRSSTETRTGWQTPCRPRGVSPGDVVLYQLYNSPQFVLSYLAPQKLGAINSPPTSISPPVRLRACSTATARRPTSTTATSQTWRKGAVPRRHPPAMMLAVDCPRRAPRAARRTSFF